MSTGNVGVIRKDLQGRAELAAQTGNDNVLNPNNASNNMSPVERERLNRRIMARLKLQARKRGLRQTEGEIDDPDDPNLFLSEPMDLAFRLLKIKPGLAEAAQSIVSGSSAPEIPQIEEPPEIEEEESEMDRLDRELKVAEDALARSRKIHANMGENWKGPKRSDMRGSVYNRTLPRDDIDLEEF